MTGQQLRPLLDELVENMPTPDLAAGTWEAGRRHRRRMHIAVSSSTALVTVLAVGVAAFVAAPDRNSPPVVAPTGTASGLPSRTAEEVAVATRRLDATTFIAPSRADEERLPWGRPVLPRQVDLGGRHPTLAADPPERVVALFQQWGDEPGPLLALGADGGLRTVEVDLEAPRDAEGNLGQPLSDTALRGDGTAAAFAEPQQVTVVDLATGAVRRIPLAGFNEQVRWHPDGRRLLVGREAGSVLLDTATGRAQPVAGASAFGDTTFNDDGSVVVTLSSPAAAADGSPTGPPLLFRNAITGAAYSGSVVELRVRDVGSWYGATHLRSDRLARGGWRTDSTETVTVVDASDGTLQRALTFELAGRWKGCCPVLGWLDQQTVLLASRGDGPGRVLAWDVGSGALSRVTEFDTATVSLARLQ